MREEQRKERAGVVGMGGAGREATTPATRGAATLHAPIRCDAAGRVSIPRDSAAESE